MQVQPKENSRIILWNCQLMWILMWKAWNMRLYDFFTMYSLIYLTSILHWNNPIRDSWRQRLDRKMVETGIFYLLVRSWMFSYFLFFWYVWGISLGFYFYKKAKQNDDKKIISMRWHLLMHYTGHFTNWICFYYIGKH